MQWVIEKKEKNERYAGRILKNKETRGRKLVVDKLVKACPTCGRTYEKITMGNHQGKRYMYYKKGQIPTYGKKKEICKLCEVKNG